MLKLSAVIITLNEERNILRCLESVRDIADDIVVVDSNSTDATARICTEFGVTFIARRWQGYSATKNFANTQAKYDWILSLDADEALSDELRQSISAIKQGEGVHTCAFNRLSNYCGSWIRHGGWYPDTKIRIFNRRVAHWEGELHEALVFEPPQIAIPLDGDCFHYSYFTIAEHREQARKYAELSAYALFLGGQRASKFSLIIEPIKKFLDCCIVKLGILDGYHGIVIGLVSAYGTYLERATLRTLRHKHHAKMASQPE